MKESEHELVRDSGIDASPANSRSSASAKIKRHGGDSRCISATTDGGRDADLFGNIVAANECTSNAIVWTGKFTSNRRNRQGGGERDWNLEARNPRPHGVDVLILVELI